MTRAVSIPSSEESKSESVSSTTLAPTAATRAAATRTTTFIFLPASLDDDVRAKDRENEMLSEPEVTRHEG